MKTMILTLKLGIELNLLETKRLWNQIQTQTKTQIKFLRKFQNVPTLIYLLQKYKTHLLNYNNSCLKFSNQIKLKLKKNVCDYNNKKEWKLQRNFYENKNCNEINGYNNWINLY